jgi:uncharacterized protein YyaL (SSP411 family)
MAEAGRPKLTNHLAGERSLYLRQHAQSPVDWYPWGKAAFDKAEREDRPVFLSIGYSACHWCHVMARESFEDQQVADLLNRLFVPIKVDKEERPDVDAVYMTVCNMMTGSGGWPLSIFLKPDKTPFWAATYLPKVAPPGGTGFIEVLEELSSAWRIHRDGIDQMAGQILTALREFVAYKEPGKLDPGLIDEANVALRDSFDPVSGGFNGAPKFPSPHRLLFLLQRSAINHDERALMMVKKTLTAMAAGGIHDQLAGGFHRYSTDRAWLLPHFEKMLYDQALIALAYAEAYGTTGEEQFAHLAREMLEFTMREMAAMEGGFSSAVGADSEGEEGRFYLWTRQEVEALLGSDAPLFCAAYDVRPEGNFVDEGSRRRTGKNILHRVASDAELAVSFDMTIGKTSETVSRCRNRLMATRAKRVAPDVDDKVLTDWNGMMIASLARSSRLLADHSILEAAEDAARFMLKRLRRDDGRLWHRYAGGEAAIDGFLDDYAFLAWGLIELREATESDEWGKEANALIRSMIEHFADRTNGGFYQTADGAEDMLVRMKEAYDGATPSANSMAAECLVRLANGPGNDDLRPMALKAIGCFAKDIGANPAAYVYMLHAFSLAVGKGPFEEATKQS